MSDLGPWQRLKRRLEARDTRVRVGVLSSEGGEQITQSGATILQIALIHEFGAPAAGIPRRSFIRDTVDEKQSEISAATAKLLRQVVTGRMTLERALGLLGAQTVALIRERMRTSIPPPLAPQTVARKGSNVTLIDTGRLLSAITFRVEGS